MPIETKNLTLRPFTEADAPDLFEYLHAPDRTCFYDMKVESSEDAVSEAKKRSEQELYLAVVLKESGKVIGEVCAESVSVAPGSPCDTWSPLWMLNSAYRGRGFGYEAVHAFLDYIFTEKNARRVYIYTEDTNIACQKLCEKLGARKEGVFIEYVSFVNDTHGEPIYENTIQYAILRKEWL